MPCSGVHGPFIMLHMMPAMRVRRWVIVLALAASASFAPSHSSTRTAGLPAADSTIVVLLGTGMPRPDPDASGPATAVVVGSRFFLFDAGPGVVRRLSAARLPINGVTALFVTHLHSDHTLGYPDLIF